MAEVFKVGDLVEVVESVLNPHLAGLQYTVISELHPHPLMPSFFGSLRFHTLRAQDGETYWATPETLRKIKPPPPREDIGEWELCPWKPQQVTVTEPT